MAANSKHLTKTNEQYTPVDIIDRARRVLKRIDLDPASSKLANSRVGAEKIFTRKDGAETFRSDWCGRIWMNPPGGANPVIKTKLLRSNPALFWEKLVYEWDKGHVEAAIVLGFTLEVLQTTQRSRHPMLEFPLCIPKQRLRFDTPRRARIESLEQQLAAATKDSVVKALTKKLADANNSQEKLIPGDQPTHCNVLVLVPPSDEWRGDAWEGPFVRRFKTIFSPVGFVRV